MRLLSHFGHHPLYMSYMLVGIVICVVIGLVGIRTFSMYQLHELPLVIVIPSYNNAAWYEKNLSSVLTQRYKNFRIIYIDDASSDGTGELVATYLHTSKKNEHVELIRNKKRVGALANHVHAIAVSKPHEIIVSLDGDDWFAHEHVLADINTLYQLSGCLLTYGQFQNWPTGEMGWCRHIPLSVARQNKYREYGFVSAQPRTYYVWLARHINDKDLRDEASNYLSVAGDVALMMPLLEMSGGRYVFTARVLCMRNVATPLNDFKLHREQQKNTTKKIRLQRKYLPLP